MIISKMRGKKTYKFYCNLLIVDHIDTFELIN